MHISTETNFSGVAENHPWSAQFTALGYDDGAISTLPHQFFRDWLDQEPTSGHFYIGRGSGFGVGSLVKYDSGQQSLVSDLCCRGSRLVSSSMAIMRCARSRRTASSLGGGLKMPPPHMPTGDQDDVWIGDE